MRLVKLRQTAYSILVVVLLVLFILLVARYFYWWVLISVLGFVLLVLYERWKAPEKRDADAGNLQ